MVDIVAKKVKLKTSDNIIKEVDSDILMKSKLLRGLFEDLEPEELEEIIALNGVDSKYLDLIIKYLEHYKDMEPKEIPKPFPERTDEEFMKGILNDQWTYEYLTKSNS